MDSEERIESEGRTLKDAVENACTGLGISRSEIEYRLCPEHFRGGAETVRIEAWRKAAGDVNLPKRVESLLSGILKRMEFKGEVVVDTQGGNIRAVLRMEDSSLILGSGGQTLEALQHIVNKALNSDRSDKRIVVDLENYREKHEEHLRFVAKKVCEKVLEEECVVTLKPMNAYDRRLVHLEVAEHPKLGSRSGGDGQLKRVQVYVKGDEI